MNKDFLFLLGGHDLEMITIKSLLQKYGLPYEDRGLKWGAKWSNYKDIIEKNPGKTFVGIELDGKEDKPDDAIDIDHHNAESEKPSSLEQIVNFINKHNLTENPVQLTREQKLIAANDKGYIPAMELLCGSEKEIKEVRKKDRITQGVTEQDEKLAKETVNKITKEEFENEFVVVQSLTDKFSAVRDRLWFDKNIRTDKKLIIYNDNSLAYYGPVTEKLTEHYKNEIEQGKAYYGGSSSNGFFGLSKSLWTKVEIEKEIKTIKQKTQTDKLAEGLYSYHIFLFPFRWKNINKSEHLQNKWDLNIFEEKITKDDRWCRNRFSLNNPAAYNEYNYFYDFVREVMYDLNEDLKTNSTRNNEKLIRHFEYQPADISNDCNKPLYYHIKIKNKEHFALEIDSIVLNVYGTGTGILSFHLRNKKYPDKNDILKINQYGRRIYPPFLGLDDETIITGKKDHTDFSKQMEGAKIELPEALWISDSFIDDLDTKENKQAYHFSEYGNKDNYKYGPFQLPEFIKELFPEKFFAEHEKYFIDEKKEKIKENTPYKIYLRPALDDRMFVISWYGNNDLANRLKHFDYNEKQYCYSKDDWWYKYVFVDGPGSKTCQNKLLCPELSKKSTYDRWLAPKDYPGTLFGMSRYSLVMLTGNYPGTPAFLIRHLQTMYYKMQELVLLQRASVLSFSDEVTHISDLVHTNIDEDAILGKINDLYAHYILFVNKIYFREVTAQEQGIEMYDVMQKAIRIERDVKDLDSEISELNAYANMIREKRENEEAIKHTALATIFLPAMLFTAFMGMNVMPEKWIVSHTPYWPFWIAFFITIILIVGFLLKGNSFLNYVNSLFKKK